MLGRSLRWIPDLVMGLGPHTVGDDAGAGNRMMDEMMQPPPRIRLDNLLVARGLVRTRAQARDAILRGAVAVAGLPARKAGLLVAPGVDIEINGNVTGHVSRGALKLAAALEAFRFDPAGRTCLDIGASTGGFTEILLERGAAKVYAIDVGRGQLDASLAADDRVVSLEGLDARELDGKMIAEPVGAIVVDVSFISLKLVLEPVLRLAAPGAFLAALIKPQFEVGRDGVGRGGIVRDAGLRDEAVSKLRDWLDAKPRWQVGGVIASPIEGGSGNKEYLMGALHDR